MCVPKAPCVQPMGPMLRSVRFNVATAMVSGEYYDRDGGEEPSSEQPQPLPEGDSTTADALQLPLPVD